MHDFRESGLVFHWMNEYMIPSSEFCNDMQKTRHQEKPIVIEKLVGLFFILLAGSLISAIVVGLEKLFSKYKICSVVQFQAESKNVDTVSQPSQVQESALRHRGKTVHLTKRVSEA